MTNQKINEETLRRIQAERRRVLEALDMGVRAFKDHNPNRLVAVKAGDIGTLTEWVREFIDREQHNGLITKT